MKFIDVQNKRIVHTGSDPGPDFWDSIWKQEQACKDYLAGIKETLVSKITKNYLSPEDGLILEGGCGSGGNVISLSRYGYKAVGVDFAEDTVKWLNHEFPELDIKIGDIRNLPYGDDYFSGYWSLGVIEHFQQEDYERILYEMSRVIKSKGYLFVSFPYMSLLRKIKMILGRYKRWQEGENKYGFYEYFLNADTVIGDLEKRGFVQIKKYHLNPIKGTKDEVACLRPLLQILHDYRGENSFVKLIKYALSKILSPFAGHSLLLVMRKI